MTSGKFCVEFFSGKKHGRNISDTNRNAQTEKNRKQEQVKKYIYKIKK